MTEVLTHLFCKSCNRGIWITTDVSISVEADLVYTLGSIKHYACLKCGREYICEIVGSKGTLYTARSDEALSAIQLAVKEEWTDRKAGKKGKDKDARRPNIGVVHPSGPLGGSISRALDQRPKTGSYEGLGGAEFNTETSSDTEPTKRCV